MGVQHRSTSVPGIWMDGEGEGDVRNIEHHVAVYLPVITEFEEARKYEKRVKDSVSQ